MWILISKNCGGRNHALLFQIFTKPCDHNCDCSCCLEALIRILFLAKKIFPRLGTEWIFVKSHTCQIYEMSLQFLLTSSDSAFSLTPKPSDGPEHIEILSNIKVKVKVAQSYPTLLQARILEWVAFPFSRGSSQPRDKTQVFHITGGFFTSWATREVPPNIKVPLYSLKILSSAFQWLIIGSTEFPSTGLRIFVNAFNCPWSLGFYVCICQVFCLSVLWWWEYIYIIM